jgi:hypothetical protein
MAVTIYDQVFAFIDGKLLTESTSVAVELQGDDQDVMTIVKGWSGVSPSPKKIMVSFENVVPVTGFEFDPMTSFNSTTIHELLLVLGAAGKQLKSTGLVRAPKVNAGVGQTTTLSFEFHGTPDTFK